MKKRCIISVYDKSGLKEFSKGIIDLDYEIFSTGGTYKYLKTENIPVKSIEEITNFPEILAGRVKTLNPYIYGGILYVRGNNIHEEEIKNNNISPVDMVICNLYPFKEVAAKHKLYKYPNDDVIENIDIGGVSILRAAAKNYNDVVVICSTADYIPVLNELKQNKNLSKETKYELAKKVFSYTSTYDQTIFGYLSGSEQKETDTKIIFPQELNINLSKIQDLRYGENPHQAAAFYKNTGIKSENDNFMKKLQGKELSYNNYLDIDSAYNIMQAFEEPACVIVKHNNPCGVATDNNVKEAFKNAYSCDVISAFGGIIGFNAKVDELTAEEIIKTFFECIIAPDYTENALNIFKKKENLRILKYNELKTNNKTEIEIRQLTHGFVAQTKDNIIFDKEPVCVTKRKPTSPELKALNLGWKVCKYVKSNAVVFTNQKMTLGIGCGQTSRIDSIIIAREKAKNNNLLLKNSVLASDAFFPFSDSVEEVSNLGVTAIIQPGGSIKDKEVIEMANNKNIAMLFTGIRHFKH